MEEALVLFNPNAARGRAHRRLAELRRRLDEAACAYDLMVTQGKGHAIEVARQAIEDGRQLLVAAGGDGTVNEVVNGICHAREAGAGCLLGVLPMGSGNDFASSLGIPLDLDRAIQRLKSGKARTVDVGLANGRYFDNNVGIGFEARINIEAHKLPRLRGQWQYLAAVFRALVHYSLPTVDLEADAYSVQGLATLMISVGNNHRIGGGFLITPDAQPDDGLLDVCMARAISRPRILRLLPKAMKGSHLEDEAVELFRTRRLVIESQDPLPVHADGEILWNDVHRLEITILPGALRVII